MPKPVKIIVPLAGSSFFFKENELIFPKILTEICGKTMLERFIANIAQIECEFVFVLKKNQMQKYALDESIRLLAPSANIIALENETQGMALSTLFAVDFLDGEIIICNADQIITANLGEILNTFRKFDAGVITFESLHPRYSFVVTDEKGLVMQAFEKKPVSKRAIAGFYYFKNGKDFVRSCERMIEKDNQVDGSFYISPCLNEMVLENLKILAYEIPPKHYHTFYSPAKVAEFEAKFLPILRDNENFNEILSEKSVNSLSKKSANSFAKNAPKNSQKKRKTKNKE